MKAKLYAVEKEEMSPEHETWPRAVTKIAYILEPETLEDSVMIDWIDAHPEAVVFKSPGKCEIEGKWVVRE